MKNERTTWVNKYLSLTGDVHTHEAIIRAFIHSLFERPLSQACKTRFPLCNEQTSFFSLSLLTLFTVAQLINKLMRFATFIRHRAVAMVSRSLLNTCSSSAVLSVQRGEALSHSCCVHPAQSGPETASIDHCWTFERFLCPYLSSEIQRSRKGWMNGGGVDMTFHLWWDNVTALNNYSSPHKVLERPVDSSEGRAMNMRAKLLQRLSTWNHEERERRNERHNRFLFHEPFYNAVSLSKVAQWGVDRWIHF